MPDIDDLQVIRELLAGKPPSEDVNKYIKGRLTAAISSETRTVTARSGRMRLNRLAVAICAGAVAAAIATVGLVLTLTGSPAAVPTAGHARTVVTVAWTVREDADGTVTITLRQYANPAGLQRTLRADGINAIVRAMPSFTFPGRKPGPRNPLPTFTGCSYATTNDAPPRVQRHVVTIVTQVRQEPGGGTMRAATFVIHPHAMPPGSALFLPYGTNMLPRAMKGSRGPAKPAPDAPVYPHVKPFYPVVLNNDAVPACVPFTKPVSTPAPTAK
jgi:hypothetical protein